MKQFLALTLVTLALASCGKKEEFKYELSQNGCSTGEQKTDSKDALCTRLKDNAANNGCAYSLRKERFTAEGCGTWAAIR